MDYGILKQNKKHSWLDFRIEKSFQFYKLQNPVNICLFMFLRLFELYNNFFLNKEDNYTY